MINPELHAFLERWDAEWAPLGTAHSMAEMRAHGERVARNMALAPVTGVDQTRVIHIDTPEGPVRARVFRPEGSERLPCLVYLHGGAWMAGSPETHADITARLARDADHTVISVDYAKAPERPFPAAFRQVVAVLRHLAAEPAAYGIDPTRLSVGGDSAGGNLAAAAALELRGDIALLSQLLIYPVCDPDRTRPSYLENPDGPIVRPDGTVERLYCPDPAQHTNPQVWPLLAASHADLPPAFVAVAEHDPLRDSGVVYAQALEAAGVPVTLDRGTGLIHGYLQAMGYCAQARDTLRVMADWLADQAST